MVYISNGELAEGELLTWEAVSRVFSILARPPGLAPVAYLWTWRRAARRSWRRSRPGLRRISRPSLSGWARSEVFIVRWVGAWRRCLIVGLAKVDFVSGVCVLSS